MISEGAAVELRVLQVRAEGLGVTNFTTDLNPVQEGKPQRRVVGMFQGILTGETDETWPENWEDLLLRSDADARAVLSWYYGLPFARLEALRNRKRFPALVRRMVTKVRFAIDSGFWASIFLFGHSNGGVLELMVARALIAMGYRIEGLLFMAPAVRSVSASLEIAGWIAEGKLGQAHLVMATRDKTLSLVSRFKLAAWPWGALGVEGWRLDDISPEVAVKMTTTQLDVGHTTFLSVEERERTFREIAIPFLGLGEPDFDGRPTGHEEVAA